MGEEGTDLKSEEEIKWVVEEAHLVEKRQFQALPLIIAFTNVLETFKEQEHAQRKGQLKRAWPAALVLANFLEGNAAPFGSHWLILVLSGIHSFCR